jgi:L-2-hydroxyglutarate oxidase LhgO
LVVAGGGIVGLATAREFLKRNPGLSVLLVEKEKELAMHQTGHNSGVIHTGIYYTPGSLKAKLCVAGHRATIDFCKERGIPFQLSGKLIVALDEGELPRLQNLFERGTANGVQGLEVVGPERIKEIEPYASGIKAIWSPNTGVMSYKQMAQAIADDIRAWGGEVVTLCKVIGLTVGDPTTLKLHDPLGFSWEKEITAKYVITACGLHSDKVAEMTNPDNDVKIVPFRGDYYLLHPDKRHMVRSMIYPVPDPSFPFLGVHFTRLLSGEVKAGPNAVLAFAREGYGRKDFNFPELTETLTYPGFHKLAIKYWRMGLLEMYRDYVKSAYVKALQRYMPAITGDDLLPGPSGVRAQALAESGKLVDDFLIRHNQHVIHVQNAPSPAATSSLTIATHIVDEAERSFDLPQHAKV